MEKERVNHYTKRLWNANHITEIRSILKEFEFECVSKNASTSDEALHIGSVVKRKKGETKRVKINFETVNHGRYKIIPPQKVAETNARIKKAMKSIVKKLKYK